MARNFNDYKGKADGVKGKMNAPLLEPGSYPARLVGILFLGTQKQQPFQGKPKPPREEVRYTYELSHEFMQGENEEVLEDKPRWFSEDLAIFGPEADKAKLTLRNKALDPNNQTNGDPRGLLGLPCNLLIIHRQGRGDKADRTYENIGGLSAASKLKGYVQPELINPASYFDPWDAEACDLEVFNKFPEFIRKKIIGAENFHTSHLAKLMGKDSPAPVAAVAEEGDEESDNPW